MLATLDAVGQLGRSRSLRVSAEFRGRRAQPGWEPGAESGFPHRIRKRTSARDRRRPGDYHPATYHDVPIVTTIMIRRKPVPEPRLPAV